MMTHLSSVGFFSGQPTGRRVKGLLAYRPERLIPLAGFEVTIIGRF